MFIDRLKAKARNWVSWLVKQQVEETMKQYLPLIPQFIDFYNSPPERRQSYHDHTKDPLGNFGIYENVKVELGGLGIPVEEIEIDIGDFQKWMESFPEVRAHYSGYGRVFIEKSFEHYLAYHLLKLSRGDVYIDVAAAGSPWADILAKRGIQAFRLDRSYPPGIQGRNIGADASHTTLPDNFASAMSLQCAFECLQGDADIGFLKEAGRLLRRQGALMIAPLYVDQTYFVNLSPYYNEGEMEYEKEALRVWRDDHIDCPFARHYSPTAFYRRVYSNLPDSLQLKVLFLRNLPSLIAEYPGQLIYCYFVMVAQKQCPH
jgi:hypothetical protein